jgi:hypothetical protein
MPVIGGFSNKEYLIHCSNLDPIDRFNDEQNVLIERSTIPSISTK